MTVIVHKQKSISTLILGTRTVIMIPYNVKITEQQHSL